MAGAQKKSELYVTAPLVQVLTEDGKSARLYNGDLVTENISKQSVDALKSLGYVSDKNPLDGTVEDNE